MGIGVQKKSPDRLDLGESKIKFTIQFNLLQASSYG